MDDLLNELPEKKQRPNLLTILCILTFIGSGWSIIQAIYTYRTAGVISNYSQEITVEDKMLPDTAAAIIADTVLIDSTQTADVPTEANDSVTTAEIPFGIQMKESMKLFLDKDNMRNSALGSLIAAIFTLSGAILMWNLSRKGFYLYVLGVIISIVVPFYIFGNNLLVVGMSVAGGFFGLLFIVLYALNLKNMRP